MDWLLTIFAALAFFQIGFCLDYYLFREKKNFDLAKYWGLGLGTVAVFQMILGTVRMPVSREMVMVISLAAFLPWVLDKGLQMRERRFRFVLTSPRLRGASRGKVLANTVWVLFFGIIFLLTFSQGIWGHDALSFWLSKGRAFFLDGGITAKNLFYFWPFDHPLLWPLSVTWFYEILGRPEIYFVRIIPFVTFVLLFSKIKSGIWQIVFLATPFLLMTLIMPEHAGNADLLVSFFVLLATAFLLEGTFFYTGIFLGLAALTKNDSLPMLLGFIFLSGVLLRQGKWLKSGLAAAIILALFTLGFKYYFGLDNRYVDRSFFGNLSVSPFLKSAIYTAQAFREEFRQVSRWGLGWWLGVFALATGGKKILADRKLLVLAGLLAIDIVSLFWVYYVTPENQATHIATSLSRVLFQIYPAVILFSSRLFALQTKQD